MKKLQSIFRTLSLIISFVAISATFTSCSDDKEDDNKDIPTSAVIGLWRSQDPAFIDAFSEIMQFNSNGTWEGWEAAGDYPDKVSVKGNWNLKGSDLNVTVMSFNESDDAGVTVVFSITSYSATTLKGEISMFSGMKFTLDHYNP